jgi:hypothetical protein
MELNRPGDLDADTKHALDGHIAGCSRCVAAMASVNAGAAAVEQLRNSPPRLEDPEGFALSVMRSLERESRAPRLYLPARGLFSYGRTTAFCNAAAFAICALFFLQTFGDARRLETLEQRMRYDADAAAAQERSLYASRQSAVAKARGIVARGDRGQTLAAGDLGAVLAVIRSSGLGSTPEMERLRVKYPKLWSLSLDHGLDASTREVLRTEGKTFLHDVEALVRLGEQ